MFALWRKRLGRSRRQRSLALASIEAVVVAGTFAVVEFWLLPLMIIRLGAGPVAVAVLAALPLLAAGLSTPWIAHAVRFMGGVRRACAVTSGIQATALLGLLVPNLWPQEAWSLALAIALVVVFGAAGAVAGPSWVSLMAGLIPARLQGRYTTQRLRLFLATKLVMAFAAASLMQWAGTLHAWPWMVLLIIAACARFCSAWLQWGLSDAESSAGPSVVTAAPEGFRACLEGIGKLLRHSDGRWLWLWLLLHVGVAISGPFFVPFALLAGPEGFALAMAPIAFAVLMQVSQVMRLITLPAIGRLVDRYGPGPVFRYGLVGVLIAPVVWVCAPSWPWLLAAEVVAGVAWCLVENAVAVLLYRVARDPGQRLARIAAIQGMVSLVSVGGNALGAALVVTLPAWDGSHLRTVILCGTLLRLPVMVLALWWLPRFASIRPGEWWRTVLGTTPPQIGLKGLGRFLRRPEG